MVRVVDDARACGHRATRRSGHGGTDATLLVVSASAACPDLSIRRPDDLADALTVGVVRGRRWESPAYSLYLPTGTSGELATRCQALARVLPADAMFSHVTTAQLRGWWLPAQLSDAPVVATSGSAATHINRRGAYLRRCAITEADRCVEAGLQMATAERTLVELAEDLALIDLIAVVDCALRSRTCTVETLRAAVRPRRRGTRRLLDATLWADGRSESPWETYLRLLHVWADVPVEPQAVICTTGGQFVARADLLITGTRRLVEYDGAGHRERSTHRNDLRRDKALHRAAYERYGYTDLEMLKDPGRVIADADAALQRPYRPGRLLRWQREIDRSSLSREGRRLLARQMDRFYRDIPPRRHR